MSFSALVERCSVTQKFLTTLCNWDFSESKDQICKLKFNFCIIRIIGKLSLEFICIVFDEFTYILVYAQLPTKFPKKILYNFLQENFLRILSWIVCRKRGNFLCKPMEISITITYSDSLKPVGIGQLLSTKKVPLVYTFWSIPTVFGIYLRIFPSVYVKLLLVSRVNFLIR